MTRRFALLAALGATALSGGTADASVVRPERDASLRVTGLGQEPYGTAVSGVGDVNGDGRPDVAVMQEPLGGAPAVLVVLGRPGRSAIDATKDPGAAGFTITHPPDQVPFGDRGGLIEATLVGASVGPAGDVNGDGLADVLVGHAGVGNALRRGSGSAFVVFGKRDTAPVRLDQLGAGGFRVDGPRAYSSLGFQHAPLGDVDGDGLGDVVLGASGAAFVVFGSRSPETVDLRAPGRRASAYFSPLDDPDATNEHGVAAAGDANGDGRADFVLGVGGYGDLDGVREARTWVIFSKPGTAPTDLRRPGAWGYEITGTRMNGLNLGTAAPAGDVNRDGRGDLVLNNGTQSWVVPGRASTKPVDVRTAPEVLTIKGRRTQVYGDVRVAGVGDVNGDGRADVAIADSDALGPCADGNGSGAVSVVYGGKPGRVDLRRLSGQGFALTGEGTGSIVSGPVAPLGDFDGDGRDDLALTLAPFPRPNGFTLQPRDVAIVPLAPGPEAAAAPGRDGCVAVRLRTRTLRQALREGRVRARVRAARRGQVGFPFLSANLFVVLCDGPRCVLERAPGARRASLRQTPGWSPVSIDFGRRTERLLRDRRARALTFCVNEEPCVDLPVRR